MSEITQIRSGRTGKTKQEILEQKKLEKFEDSLDKSIHLIDEDRTAEAVLRLKDLICAR
jgi:hypothetical protein